jgi:hypothetical protein
VVEELCTALGPQPQSSTTAVSAAATGPMGLCIISPITSAKTSAVLAGLEVFDPSRETSKADEPLETLNDLLCFIRRDGAR